MPIIETYTISSNHENTLRTTGMCGDSIKNLSTTMRCDIARVEPVVIGGGSQFLSKIAVNGVIIEFDSHTLSRIFAHRYPQIVQNADVREWPFMIARRELDPFMSFYLFY